MPTIHLVHWNAGETEERAALLPAAGHEAVFRCDDGTRDCRRRRENPIDCLVVDLRRLPSHGASTSVEVRELGLATGLVDVRFAVIDATG